MKAARTIRLSDVEKGKGVDLVRHLPGDFEPQTRFADRKSFEKAAGTVFFRHSKLFEELAK